VSENKRANKYGLIRRTYIIFQEREKYNETTFVHGFLKKYVTSLDTKLCLKCDCLNF